jgi:hypothetical protein
VFGFDAVLEIYTLRAVEDARSQIPILKVAKHATAQIDIRIRCENERAPTPSNTDVLGDELLKLKLRVQTERVVIVPIRNVARKHVWYKTGIAVGQNLREPRLASDGTPFAEHELV